VAARFNKKKNGEGGSQQEGVVDFFSFKKNCDQALLFFEAVDKKKVTRTPLPHATPSSKEKTTSERKGRKEGRPKKSR
jgi:hypothetical protein